MSSTWWYTFLFRPWILPVALYSYQPSPNFQNVLEVCVYFPNRCAQCTWDQREIKHGHNVHGRLASASGLTSVDSSPKHLPEIQYKELLYRVNTIHHQLPEIWKTCVNIAEDAHGTLHDFKSLTVCSTELSPPSWNRWSEKHTELSLGGSAWDITTHWNGISSFCRNFHHLLHIILLFLTTSVATSDQKFVKITFFPFLYPLHMRALVSEVGASGRDK